MLRLSVPAGERLADAHSFAVHPGGAESNVCAALASLGRRCGWLSRLPDNPLGEMVLRRLRAARIDLSAVVLAPGGRVGTYYAEFAAAPRPVQVVYDRAHSAMTEVTREDVDWSYLLDARVLHLTGITPALGGACRALVGEAVTRAKQAGVLVSFDVNYRSRLWPPQEAAGALRDLFAGVDLLICGQDDARELFELGGDERQLLAGLRPLTPARQIVLTRGESGACALDGDRFLSVPALTAQTIDRFGAGDAFAAGVIDGWLDGSLAEGLRRGTALAALALSQAGDMVVTSREEMNAVLKGSSRAVLR
jgi:2-dehydro-3-deoxygluconokinase